MNRFDDMHARTSSSLSMAPLVAVVFAAFAVGLVGCERADYTDEETETIEAMADTTRQAVQAFESSVRTSLAQIDSQFQALNHRLDAVPADVRGELENRIERLETEKLDIESRLETLDARGDTAWLRAKAGIEDKLAALTDSLMVMHATVSGQASQEGETNMDS